MSNKKYWQSVEELKGNAVLEGLKQKEFVEKLPTDVFLGDKETLEASSTTRRDFLKYVGFSTAVASLASCEGPIRKAIPYVVKPDVNTVGIADWYASTIANGFDYANVLVKTREGRPIQIMPNKEANGTTNARIQASVLSLYDEHLRLKEPTKEGKKITWSSADSEIIAKLKTLQAANKPVVLLTGTIISPSAKKIISQLITAYPNIQHISYDAVSESATADAMKAVYGKRGLPNYDFSKAKVIASIGADFLGDWQGGYAKSYTASRIPEEGKMSYHVQLESNMSLTGANADRRIGLKPSEQVSALISLYNEITGASIATKPTVAEKEIQALASALKKAGSKAVVVTGLNDVNAQRIALEINKALNSEVIDIKKLSYVRQGNDAQVAQLQADLKSGAISGLITYNVNPLYTLANATDFAEGIKKLDLSVALSVENDETANAMQYALPVSHFLESWGDAMPTEGNFGLTQPTIKPLFNTRQAEDTFLKWSGDTTNYYDFLKSFWNDEILEGTSWNKVLQDGFYTKASGSPMTVDLSETNSEESAVSISEAASALLNNKKGNAYELQLYTSTAIGDGKLANNPWLQELPDPITRVTWDNYLAVSMADAEKLGFSNPVQDNGAINGNYANVTVNGVTLKNVPVIVQPGQANGSVGLALGYGRKQGLKEAMQVGVNAYPVYFGGNNVQYNVSIEKVAGWHHFACPQVQSTVAGRTEIIREVSLHDLHHEDPQESWNAKFKPSYDHKEVAAEKVDLWDGFNREIGHHFNLSIDLSTCTGCGACVIACHAENNVPVVGKKEVRVGRDMHWLRIDRYYSSKVETREEAKKMGLSGGDYFDVLENPAENPTVVFQPMMCQHCNHAPCETVCPVAATSHGRQGQNQMAYNRCVGTRYCANNCPYRVRRFNWFNYAQNKEFDFNMNDDYGRMVLNPDVVVRSRGVMEKCSMCIQMTQATILKAKKEGRAVKTDEFQTACSSACTTGAMVFGDINNKEDKVTKLKEDKRAYHVLESVATQPNVVYQVKVNNTHKA